MTQQEMYDKFVQLYEKALEKYGPDTQCLMQIDNNGKATFMVYDDANVPKEKTVAYEGKMFGGRAQRDMIFSAMKRIQDEYFGGR